MVGDWADRCVGGGGVGGWAGVGWVMMDGRVYRDTGGAIDTLSGGAGEG